MWKALIRLVESWSEKPIPCKHKWSKIQETTLNVKGVHGGKAGYNIILFCCKECGEFKKVFPGGDPEIVKRMSELKF